MACFDRLNDDVILHILDGLPIQDLLTFSQTSTRVHAIIRDSLRLQFRLSAFAENYVIRPQSLPCTVPELDTFLRQHTLTWARFEGKNKETISLPHPSLEKPMISYRKGLYVEADRNHYDVVRLNTHSTGEASTTARYSLPVDAFETKAVLVDPDQDLLILITRDEASNVRTSCFTVAGFPHPRSSGYVDCGLHDPPPPLNNLHGLRYYEEAPVPCDVCGDIIGASPSTEQGSVLHIWNWKTGAQLPPLRVGKTYTSFNFLSPTTFIASAGYHRPPTIDYYVFGTSIELERSLELPRILNDRTFAFTTTVSNPIGRRSMLPIEARVHYIRVSIDLSLSGFYNVVVNPAVLTDPTLPKGTEPIPWDWWGPDNTRWFSIDGNMYFGLHGPPCVHGSRIVIQRIDPSNNAEGPYIYVIADFNILPSLRQGVLVGAASEAESRGFTIDGSSKIITATTPIIHPAFEEGEIESRLPFREIRVKGPFARKPSWTWLDEERLIAYRNHPDELDVVYMFYNINEF
ncbi:hypothetical protein DACRYDRAFT_117895 [Dacryopinax primogenitus]|uniref:F-box domain-containing protein n=1 Tax=Dacryopinax primogenitus (strain DJM 731) TaxID=1858805 RepID=M5G1K0_DACPD|nr:uncharacterized protein DACRYDRAFT_117895 [Dacryopinax primogenitus]EJT99711.1 hypothetical protein DACRYDRAFT_117895 [Dacryopinax primogenitus]